jgi:glycosyltransferase involved in cell wall biosynthesis
MKTDPVYVLMSTYNGQKYIKPQIESLLAQTYNDIKILIRDDGSSDFTTSILKSYENKYSFVTVFYEDNKGVVQSFFRLLEKVPDEAEYIAFCDQDDLWLSDKIQRAVDKIKQNTPGLPVMYCSSLNVADENLNFLYTTGPAKKTGLSNSLFENVATGCTVVLNKKAFLLLSGKKIDCSKIMMHDFWFYIVISAFGEIIFDPASFIYYRQHKNNLVGYSKGPAFWYKRFLRFKNNNKNQRRLQIEEFLRIYGPKLDTKIKDQILLFLKMSGHKKFFKRFFYAFKAYPVRQNLIDSLIFRLLIVLKRV